MGRECTTIWREFKPKVFQYLKSVSRRLDNSRAQCNARFNDQTNSSPVIHSSGWTTTSTSRQHPLHFISKLQNNK
jgi:hypothetical protein